MNRLLPRTLNGQLISLLLLALVVSQIVSVVVLYSDRQRAIREISGRNILGRMITIVRMLEDTPQDMREQVLRAASTRRLRFWRSKESAVEIGAISPDDRIRGERLANMLGRNVKEIRIAYDELNQKQSGIQRARPLSPGNGSWLQRVNTKTIRHHISAKLTAGGWLNLQSSARVPRFAGAWPALVSLLIMATAITLIVILIVRRLTRPLRALARAAEQMGLGQKVLPIEVDGPRDIKQTTIAFNQMNVRLSRFVDDRMRMLASISHDLRTPITALRLRAELLEDTEAKARMIDNLDEMQRMAETTLAFVRAEANEEKTELIDLSALTQAVCDDLTEVGGDVKFEGSEKLPGRCRPVAIRRALQNLIENAVRYGARARVRLLTSNCEVTITVDDDGPGIPAEQYEEIFEPFVRLEDSRAKETGGVGLGLAIARSVARSHGGDITLENRAGGGLTATMTIPLAI